MSTQTILQSFNSLVNVWRQNIQYFLAMETVSRWELSTGPSMKGKGELLNDAISDKLSVKWQIEEEIFFSVDKIFLLRLKVFVW